MRDAHDASSPSLLNRLASAWRYLTYPVQADFVGLAPAVEAAEQEEKQRKADKAARTTTLPITTAGCSTDQSGIP